MRGGEVRSGSLFSYVDLEARVPRSHPSRTIRAVVDAALARLDGDAISLRVTRAQCIPAAVSCIIFSASSRVKVLGF